MRKHQILIDQSGKVEETDQNTAIAFSTDGSFDFSSVVFMSKSLKRRLVKEKNSDFESKKLYHLKLFSAAVYLLTEPHLEKLSRIIVDMEYKNNGNRIRTHLRNFYINNAGISPDKIPSIEFQQVHQIPANGEPYCHNLANEVRSKREEPDIKPDIQKLRDLV